jgi:CxxC motif-containing protein (DUF1111 family)
MRKPLFILPFVFAFAAAAAVDGGFVIGEDQPGGQASTRAPRNADLFSQHSANLPFEKRLNFKVGNGIFRKQWVSAPSSTESSDGLGPLYNARACQNCHLKDGRGRPPEPGETAVSLLLKFSDPVYGKQLQNFAIQGHEAEGELAIDYREQAVTLKDGIVVRLRQPTYRVEQQGYGPLSTDRISPRIAPPMIGMGLLELIPEASLVARADPQDKDGDGIRGEARNVASRALARNALGRFGWKAGAATVADQSAEAFAADMGLSTPLIHTSSGDCTAGQKRCTEAPNGDDSDEAVEVTAEMFDLVVFYSRNLAVPVRPAARKPNVLRGKAIFSQLGCASCHVPNHTTGNDPAQPHLSNQKIWPYTDLLLHDMGDGLADGFDEPGAMGRQWRTAPLWGLGQTKLVSGHTFLLHDGRARNVTEAIVWHGGEAQKSRDLFIQLGKTARDDLLSFLESL